MIDAKIVGEEERPPMYIKPFNSCKNCNGGAAVTMPDNKTCMDCGRDVFSVTPAFLHINAKLISFLSNKFTVPETVIEAALNALPPRIKIFHMLKAVGKEDLMDDIMSEVSRT